MVTIIGIGTQKGELTQAAAQAIEKSDGAFLRTAKTEAGKAVAAKYPHVRPLDEVYENARDFDDWVEQVCAQVLAAEKTHRDVLYLTDGEGTDACAAQLVKRTQTKTLYGVRSHRARGGEESVLSLPATDAVRKRPYLDTSVALHVTEIDDACLAGELKLWLMEYYADEQPVTLYAGGKTQTVPLCELDRQKKYDYACELSIAAQDGFYKDKFCFGDLLRIMARLTAADGCPWDKAQTHESIRTNLIEEAYEAVDAIDGGDPSAMEEEFGDVLLQAVFHCDMAKRFCEFDLSDVLATLCRKLVGRHTHIFGENKAANADEALTFWEAAKSKEKSYVSTADKINRLPECFPALLAAQKTYKKLAKAGVAAPAVSSAHEKSESGFAKQLFALVARAAEDGIDAEVALNAIVKACKKDFGQAEANGETADFLQKLCE